MSTACLESVCVLALAAGLVDEAGQAKKNKKRSGEGKEGDAESVFLV